jgi:RNA polymerase sigma-70 factor (ECF subfamily)
MALDLVAPEPTGPPTTPEEVFRDYGPRVYNLARRMLNNDADAEDVTQDVLLQVVRKLGTFRGESAFPTWLHRITVNASLAHRRRASYRQEKTVTDPMEAFMDNGKHLNPIRSWQLRPDEEAIDKETQQLLEQAIADLPENFRDVYVLADVESMPNSEIADILDLSVPAVKSRLHRARLMMRSSLAPHFEETGA